MGSMIVLDIMIGSIFQNQRKGFESQKKHMTFCFCGEQYTRLSSEVLPKSDWRTIAI